VIEHSLTTEVNIISCYDTPHSPLSNDCLARSIAKGFQHLAVEPSMANRQTDLTGVSQADRRPCLSAATAVAVRVLHTQPWPYILTSLVLRGLVGGHQHGLTVALVRHTLKVLGRGEHYAISRKVAGSCPDEVTACFN
jgi:hypothetical protein